METLQNQVQNYLESFGFNMLEKEEGFLVADELRPGGYHDTWLVWITPHFREVKDFALEENRLLEKFDSLTKLYPNARYTLLSPTLEGFTKPFSTDLKKFRINHTVPILFFDSPFKYEEGKKSIISSIIDDPIIQQRVPQPYNIFKENEYIKGGEDLLKILQKEISENDESCLRFVIGPAGGGKSVLFKALFRNIYKEFLVRKGKRQIFKRPIPLIQDYIRRGETIFLRSEFLMDNFINSELLTGIKRETFKWLIINGYAIWLFDGLDELYSGDKNFFDDIILDILTTDNSKAQIVIFARESLLTSCESLGDFLNQSPPAPDKMIRIYRLSDWGYHSKRAFAWVKLSGSFPKEKEEDPAQVKNFINYLNRTSSLKLLSGVPFFCEILYDEFIHGGQKGFTDDIELIGHLVSKIIKREEGKGLIASDILSERDLYEWVETVAWEFYDNKYAGLNIKELEEYAKVLIGPGLIDDDLNNLITILIQFPIFSPGPQPGYITFKHELVADYLAGSYLFKSILNNPDLVVRSLGDKIDLTQSLIARYIAKNIPKLNGGLDNFVKVMQEKISVGREFRNFLILLLLASPVKDIIKKYGITLEGLDLSRIEFIQRDLKRLSFRNCDLTNTIFRECDLENSKFEGAHFIGTRFERLSKDALMGASFGNLEYYQCIYDDKRRLDEYNETIEWIKKITGKVEEIKHPCPTALQIREIFLKYLNPNGTSKRDLYKEINVKTGRRYAGAPELHVCIEACIRFGYLKEPDERKRIARAIGDRYSEIIDFIRNVKLSQNMRQMIISICPISGCEHIPKSF